VILVLERADDTGCEVTCYDIISRFDEFLEDACREQQLNKPDVFAEACEVFCCFLEVGLNPVRNIRKIYDDCLSGSLCTSDQCETSVKDTLITLSRTIAETPWLVTSRGLIAGLAREDERLKMGDVLAMKKGTQHTWLPRPVTTSDYEEYTFVGACRKLYEPALYGKIDYPELDDRDKMTEEFFAGSELREFRSV
jgi:hypothetical protein